MNPVLETELEPAATPEQGKDGPIWLFVCTGNTCRSPMAAAAAGQLLAPRKITARSAGIFVPHPAPIAENAVLALESRGIVSTPENDYKNHRSRQLTKELLEMAERVYGLTDEHTFAILTAFPEYAGKLCPLGVNISDPFGGPPELYEATLDSIITAILAL